MTATPRTAIQHLRRALLPLAAPRPELRGWRLRELDLVHAGIEARFEHTSGRPLDLRFSRPGLARAWRRVGPFDLAIVEDRAAAPGGPEFPWEHLLARFPDTSAPARWPEWRPDPPVMIILSGVARSGTGWLNRILRTLLNSAGHLQDGAEAPAGGPRDFVPQVADDARLDALAAAIDRHHTDPRQVWWCKTNLFAGSPTTDHPAFRTLFIYRDLHDVAVSQFHRLRHARPGAALDGRSDEELFTSVLEQRLPMARAALERVAAGVPDTTLVIRYERLLADRVGEIARLARHLGVALPDDFLRAIAVRHGFERESGRRPGDQDRTSYHRRGQAGRWREDLSPEFAERLDAHTSEIAALLQAVDPLAERPAG